MDLKLYEINQEIEKCMDLNTGEIVDELMLDKLEMAKPVKVQNIGLIIKSFAATSAAIKDEISKLAQRKKTVDNKVEWLKNYLEENITEDEKFEFANLVIKFSKSKAIVTNEFYNVESLHASYPDMVKEVTSYVLDKKEAKKLIESGTNITGIEIEERRNLQIK